MFATSNLFPRLAIAPTHRPPVAAIVYRHHILVEHVVSSLNNREKMKWNTSHKTSHLADFASWSPWEKSCKATDPKPTTWGASVTWLTGRRMGGMRGRQVNEGKNEENEASPKKRGCCRRIKEKINKGWSGEAICYPTSHKVIKWHLNR